MLGFPRVCVPVCCTLSCVPCDLPHLVFVCVSRPVSRAAERPPVAAARLVSLALRESTEAGRRSDTGKFLG